MVSRTGMIAIRLENEGAQVRGTMGITTEMASVVLQ